MLTLTVTFSRVKRVSTGADAFFASSIEQSVMIFGRDRGRGRNFVGRGRDLLEVNMACMEADTVPLRKDLSNADTVDTVITSPRSAGRNLIDLNGHNYLSLILLLHVPLLGTIDPPPPLFLDLSLLY